MSLNQEVAFKVPSELYDMYRAYCKTKEVLPANDLKAYMKRTVGEISVKEEYDLKLACINLHMKNSSMISVPFAGSEETRIRRLALDAIATKADIISANEFAPAKGDIFLDIMQAGGYQAYFSPDYVKEDNMRAYCITVLFIKKNRDIEFKPVINQGPRHLRQVEGVLSYRGVEIDLLALHILPVSDVNKVREVEMKEEHLVVVKDFVAKARRPLVIMGDTNTDYEKKDVGFENLKSYISTLKDITPEENTHCNKRLLRVICSPILVKDHIREVLKNVVRLGLTDHAIITTTISVERLTNGL